MPLDLLKEHREELRNHLDEDVVLICRSGARAAQAEQTPAGAGLPNLKILNGGMMARQAANAPINRGTPRWDLERQVRLVAGGRLAGRVPEVVLRRAFGWFVLVMGAFVLVQQVPGDRVAGIAVAGLAGTVAAVALLAAGCRAGRDWAPCRALRAVAGVRG